MCKKILKMLDSGLRSLRAKMINQEVTKLVEDHRRRKTQIAEEEKEHYEMALNQ